MTEASEPELSELIVYRPVSQMLKLLVLPEIDRRVGSGAIRKAGLPLQFNQFRVVQPGPGHVVELNDEHGARSSSPGPFPRSRFTES